MEAVKIYEVDLPKWVHSEFLSFAERKVDMKKGEYILVNVKGGQQVAIIACPKCGAKRPTKLRKNKKGHQILFEDRKISIKPSLNNDDGGCCDYHGFLSNNIFTNV